jgi:hypothetical protein
VATRRIVDFSFSNPAKEHFHMEDIGAVLQAEIAAEQAADERLVNEAARDPANADTRLLREAMARSGITLDQFQERKRNFAKRAALEQQVTAAAAAKLADELAAAGRALDEFHAESDRIVAERDAKRLELWATFDRLQRQSTVAHDAQQQLEKLEAANWRLFGLPEPPPAPTLQQAGPMFNDAPPPAREPNPNPPIPVIQPFVHDGVQVCGCTREEYLARLSAKVTTSEIVEAKTDS